MPKLKEKEIAIALRRKGLSYSEILGRVSVAKSTLSLWLRSVGLSKRQKQRLTEKKLAAALRGAHRRKQQRIETTREIQKRSIQEVEGISTRELWLMGTMLYWAEGSKEKEGTMGSGVEFTNSDPLMIRLFLKWLLVNNVSKSQIKYEIYIHENYRYHLGIVRKFWAGVTGSDIASLQKVYFKRHKLKTNRKNIGDGYRGLLRIRVRASSVLQRRISGWIEGVCKNCGVV